MKIFKEVKIVPPKLSYAAIWNIFETDTNSQYGAVQSIIHHGSALLGVKLVIQSLRSEGINEFNIRQYKDSYSIEDTDGVWAGATFSTDHYISIRARKLHSKGYQDPIDSPWWFERDMFEAYFNIYMYGEELSGEEIQSLTK